MNFINGLPYCESLTNKPSEHKDGWLQWGYVDNGGEWQAIYGLEKSHSQYEAFYLMDAAGVCEAVGQPGGAIVKTPDQGIVSGAVDTPAVVEQPVMPVDSIPVSAGGFPVLPVLAVALLAASGFVWSRKKRSNPSLVAAANPWNDHRPSRSIHFQANGDIGDE